MFSVLVIRLRSLRLLMVSGIVMRLRMFLMLITFLMSSHSFTYHLLVICTTAYLLATIIILQLITFLKASHLLRNRLLVIYKNAYLFATMIMTSVSSPFSCCSGIVRLNLM